MEVREAEKLENVDVRNAMAISAAVSAHVMGLEAPAVIEAPVHPSNSKHHSSASASRLSVCMRISGHNESVRSESVRSEASEVNVGSSVRSAGDESSAGTSSRSSVCTRITSAQGETDEAQQSSLILPPTEQQIQMPPMEAQDIQLPQPDGEAFIESDMNMWPMQNEQHRESVKSTANSEASQSSRSVSMNSSASSVAGDSESQVQYSQK